MTEPVADHAPADEPLVVELARAGEGAGGKAAGLARLVAAGLPVPAGFALTGAAFRAVVGESAAAPALDALGEQFAAWAHAAEDHEVPAALAADVIARARALGGSLIVRSSMAIEDGTAHAAPGVGLSVAGVAPDDVWTAIRAVWVASLTPMVAIYARAQSAGDVVAPGIVAPGVVVQREVAGDRVTVYTRAPGRPDDDEVWLAAPPAQRETARRDASRPELALALAAERAIGATRGADVELVRAARGASRDDRGGAGDAAGQLFVVQARALVHPVARARRSPPPPFVLAALRASGRRWRRDVAHNPAPLSTAQAELCDLVERAAIAPFHLAVAAGFLYDAPRAGAPAVAAPRTAAELEARYAAAASAVDAALALAADELASAPLDRVLGRALDAYVTAYRAIVELAPSIAAARMVLVAALIESGASPRAAYARAAELAPRRPSSLVAAVACAARGEINRAALLARAGDFAPVWDVASPTFAETPALLDDAIARARARPPLPPEPKAPPELASAVAVARAAADIAERDDLLFARAQATVRRALLTVAERLGIPTPDVFWLPFDELRSAPAAASVDARWRSRVAGRVSAARAAAARASAWEMPLAVGPDDGPPAAGAATEAATSWIGDGFGGRAAGPAVRIDHVGSAARVPRGAVVVTRAVTPAMALLVEGAAAIVCEHGSLLDHGAAMARELGVPCVVGCTGVVDAVIDDDWLEVDGDAGSVARR